MRGAFLLLLIGMVWLPRNWTGPSQPQKTRAAKPAVVRVGFEKQIKPILSAKCQPCHFPGGSMHARLPFDQPATIRKLGTTLFSRIRDEKDRAVIGAFLAQSR